MAKFIIEMDGLYEGAFEIEAADIYNALRGVFDGVQIRVEAVQYSTQANGGQIRGVKMVIDKKTRDEWRELAEQGLHSALGEYTPVDEFVALLDYIDELEAQLTKR